ncbi:MAG: redoxin domain-containing protein [Sedimentibacter sp.]
MKKIITLLIMITVLTAGCSDTGVNEQNQDNTQQEDTQINSNAIIAPDFELESIDGTTIKLSNLKDKNVIINFWATWCGFCVTEMPDLQRLQDIYKDKDLLILTVNVGETKEQVQKFMEDNNLELAVVLDKDMEVSNMYGVRSFPTTIAVNKKGEAVRGYVGMLTYEQMEQLYDYFQE